MTDRADLHVSASVRSGAETSSLVLELEGVADAVQETVAYLDTETAERAIALDPYWPKWESPWWRMTLLWELGLADRIPGRALASMTAALASHYLRTFPFHEADIPAGCDPRRHIACHCALGTMVQVLEAAGIDVDRRLPWISPWFLRYQLADGGLNCDEAAYTRATPRSSFLSTLPCAEAMLALAARRPLSPQEETFLDRAAAYLLNRRLARSLSKGGAVIDDAWFTPVFPRFYEYDALRGLSFVTRWAARRGVTLPQEAVAEAHERLATLFATGAPPRTGPLSQRSYRPDAQGVWQSAPAGSFTLLERSARPDVARLRLEFAWRACKS